MNKLNSATGKFKRYDQLKPNSGGLTSLKILSITEYDRENLILGTWDGGLNILTKNREL
ncbi:MAG: hypothetical protein HC905_07725 [Bacteroidales bacterium]|nr:hypothetical protein [Bacteroidales bacterium]